MKPLTNAMMATISLEIKRFLPAVLLTVALVAAAIWAWNVLRDLSSERDDEVCSNPEELLTPISNAFEAGYMSPEEYERAREAAARNASSAAEPPDDPPGEGQGGDPV